jgi:hypothetical protein
VTSVKKKNEAMSIQQVSTLHCEQQQQQLSSSITALETQLRQDMEAFRLRFATMPKEIQQRYQVQTDACEEMELQLDFLTKL